MGGMKIHTHIEVVPCIKLNEQFHLESLVILAVQKGDITIHCKFVSYLLIAGDLFFMMRGAVTKIRAASLDLEFLGIGYQKDYLKKQRIALLFKGIYVMEELPEKVVF